MIRIKKYLFALVLAALLAACSPSDGNFTGSEYMPDMAHSIAYEANVYTHYGLNTWDEASTVDLKKLSNPGEPVVGTVPRGYAGSRFSADDTAREEMMATLRGENSTNAIAVPVNGSVPYYYGDTEEERTRATAELINNPFPITEDGLAKGKELYTTFCGICHGEKGDGLGYLYNEEANPNAKYPAAPANLIAGDLLTASNGRYYHAIMYGKNVMGAYKDKISYEERWQVIHYIRSLQAKETKTEYSAELNTLNDSFGTPVAILKEIAEANMPTHAAEVHEEDAHNGEGNHSNEDDHGTH